MRENFESAYLNRFVDLVSEVASSVRGGLHKRQVGALDVAAELRLDRLLDARLRQRLVGFHDLLFPLENPISHQFKLIRIQRKNELLEEGGVLLASGEFSVG